MSKVSDSPGSTRNFGVLVLIVFRNESCQNFGTDRASRMKMCSSLCLLHSHVERVVVGTYSQSLVQRLLTEGQANRHFGHGHSTENRCNKECIQCSLSVSRSPTSVF